MKKLIRSLVSLCLCSLLMLGISHKATALSDIGSDAFFEDRDLIAKTVELTAPGASYAARLALAAVIVNRAKDARFPSEIRAVIYERGAFECVLEPSFEHTQVSYLSKVAARDALLGFDVTSGALYFKKGVASSSDGACFHHSGFLFFKDRPDS